MITPGVITAVIDSATQSPDRADLGHNRRALDLFPECLEVARMPRKTKDRKPAPRAANRNRLMVCDSCGWQVRATIGPYAQRRALYDFDPEMVARCVCGATLRFKDISDAVAVDDREAEQHPEYEAEQTRWVRRVLREQRGGGPVGQCGGCRKPITKTNELCRKCSFQNDLRGRRNHGYYTEGSSGRSDRLPF